MLFFFIHVRHQIQPIFPSANRDNCSHLTLSKLGWTSAIPHAGLELKIFYFCRLITISLANYGFNWYHSSSTTNIDECHFVRLAFLPWHATVDRSIQHLTIPEDPVFVGLVGTISPRFWNDENTPSSTNGKGQGSFARVQAKLDGSHWMDEENYRRIWTRSLRLRVGALRLHVPFVICMFC